MTSSHFISIGFTNYTLRVYLDAQKAGQYIRKGRDYLFWNKKKSLPEGIGAADFACAGTPLKFNSVEFRDGQQSLFATRMTTADMAPLLSRMDQVGYDSIEMWGAQPLMLPSAS